MKDAFKIREELICVIGGCLLWSDGALELLFAADQAEVHIYYDLRALSYKNVHALPTVCSSMFPNHATLAYCFLYGHPSEVVDR